jgi:hypothetical protein
MVINRIRALTGGQGGGGDNEVPYGDFVVVSGPFGRLCVTRAVARDIERQLDARWPARWVTFRDRAGSRVRLRAEDVRALVESTARQRATDRLLERARALEEEETAFRPPWKDEL